MADLSVIVNVLSRLSNCRDNRIRVAALPHELQPLLWILQVESSVKFELLNNTIPCLQCMHPYRATNVVGPDEARVPAEVCKEKGKNLVGKNTKKRTRFMTGGDTGDLIHIFVCFVFEFYF